MVACGPYMLSNGSYKPLMDLKKYVIDNKPHALILIGPMVDSQNPNILQCAQNAKFANCYESLIEVLMDQLKK